MHTLHAGPNRLATMNPAARSRMIWWLWLATWSFLAAGYVDRAAWHLFVGFSAVHAVGFVALAGGRVAEFPVQVRIAFALLAVVGVYVPGFEGLQHAALIGGAANLLVGYCLLARMLTLAPWNRPEPLSASLVWRVLVTPPTQGRFQPAPGAQAG